MRDEDHRRKRVDYLPDVILRLASSNGPRHVTPETKGYDPLGEVKEVPAHRWCSPVNAGGRFGQWRFAMARKMADVPFLIGEAALALLGHGEN